IRSRAIIRRWRPLFKNTSETYGNYWRIFSEMNYGFSEERFRIYGGFQQKFNNISKPVFRISGGVSIEDIHELEPISALLNGITTQFFERNYLKLYERISAQAGYSQEVFNGLHGFVNFGYEQRNPLFNHWNSTWVNREEVELTSNN